MAGFFSDQVQFFVAGSELGSATTKACVRLVNNPLDVTAFLNNAEKQNPNVRSDAIEWAGFFDDASRSIDGLMSGSIGTVGDVVSFAVGTAIGKRAYSAKVQWRSVGIPIRVKDMVRVESVWQPDGTISVAKHFGTPTSTTAEVNSGSIDDSAASTGTGTVFIHITRYVNSPTFTAYLMDSADGTTFAVKSGVFIPTGTGATALEFTGTLRRYVRFIFNNFSTGSGSPSGTATMWVSYVRP